MASPYKSLQRFVKRSANNSETVGHKDLRLGQIVSILVFYNISFSWLLPPNGFQFNFLLRDSENDLLFVVTTSASLSRVLNFQDGVPLLFSSFIPWFSTFCRFKMLQWQYFELFDISSTW